MAIFLVDLENTGLSGLSGIDRLSEKNKVIIFYGTRTGSIAFDKHVELSSMRTPILYKKAEKTGKNYLDFQLSTYLGYLIGTGEACSFYIISRDTGYDSVIDFWKKQCPEVKIKRQGQICRETEQNAKTEKVHALPEEAAVAQAALADVITAAESKSPQEGNGRQAEAQKELKEELQAGKEEKREKPEAEAKKSKKGKSEEEKGAKKLPEGVKKKIRKAVEEENLKGGSYTKLYEYMQECTDKQKLNTALVKAFQQEKGNRLYKQILDVFLEYHTLAR